MTDPARAELRRLAERATPAKLIVGRDLDRDYLLFVAAANPQAVIGMLDRLDEAEKEIRRLQRDLDTESRAVAELARHIVNP